MRDKDFESNIRKSLEGLNMGPSPQVWGSRLRPYPGAEAETVVSYLAAVAAVARGDGWWGLRYGRRAPGRPVAAAGQQAPTAPAAPARQNPPGASGRSVTPTNAGHSDPASGPPVSTPTTSQDEPVAVTRQQVPLSPATGRQNPGATSGRPIPATTTGHDEPTLTAAGPSPDLRQRFTALAQVRVPPGKMPETGTKPGKPRPLGDRWQTRLSIDLGISGQGQFAQWNTYMASGGGYLNLSPPGNGNSSGPLPGGGGSGTYVPAARRPEPGVQVRLSEQYRLARHWKVQAGLSYAFWQTAFDRLQISSLPATSNEPPTYLGSTGGQLYVNKYSLWQLPLGVTWLIAPDKGPNPAFYTNISLGYISGNHIMQYTPDSLVYRPGSDLLRHWSGYWEAGFSLDIYHKGSRELFLGPVFQYGFSGIQVKGSVTDHLNFAGLRLGMGF